MFEIVCEVTRGAARNNYLQKRTNYIKKANRIVAVRPVERTGRTDIEEAIFEKYNEYGKINHRSLPKHSIFDKRV